MLIFLGIILWMGLMQFPQLRDYWSTTYGNSIRKMSHNRFEMLLSMFHIVDNGHIIDTNGRLHQISNLNLIQLKCKNSYIPEEYICIHESNVPLRGRLHFRQYIHNKLRRYGIKQFNLCVSCSYSWSFFG